MIRYQFHKAKILFIGINPHHGSYARGVPFSNNKMFWYLLNRAGIIKEDPDDLKDDRKLKAMYENKFNKVYRLGMLSVVDRPSRDVTELKKGEERAGQKRIRSIAKNEKPAVMCFVGKVTYQKFSVLKECSFGWQDDIFSSKVFVMHFPLHGRASVRIRELKQVAKKAGL
jgi:TDG/mug DNA glycosylase family protein